MDFHDFTHYLEMWNKFIVLPGITIYALVLHMRKRKFSTKFMLMGLVLFVIGDCLTFTYRSTPLHLIYISGMVLALLGMVLGVFGCVRYWREDYVSKTKNT